MPQHSIPTTLSRTAALFAASTGLTAAAAASQLPFPTKPDQVLDATPHVSGRAVLSVPGGGVTPT